MKRAGAEAAVTVTAIDLSRCVYLYFHLGLQIAAIYINSVCMRAWWPCEQRALAYMRHSNLSKYALFFSSNGMWPNHTSSLTK
jgi:hypothetical protein